MYMYMYMYMYMSHVHGHVHVHVSVLRVHLWVCARVASETESGRRQAGARPSQGGSWCSRGAK